MWGREEHRNICLWWWPSCNDTQIMVRQQVCVCGACWSYLYSRVSHGSPSSRNTFHSHLVVIIIRCWLGVKSVPSWVWGICSSVGRQQLIILSAVTTCLLTLITVLIVVRIFARPEFPPFRLQSGGNAAGLSIYCRPAGLPVWSGYRYRCWAHCAGVGLKSVERSFFWERSLICFEFDSWHWKVWWGSGTVLSMESGVSWDCLVVLLSSEATLCLHAQTVYNGLSHHLSVCIPFSPWLG